MKIQNIESRALISCREDFPSLAREHHGSKLIYLDGPGGSQVPNQVIEAISHYYRTSNSNTHGAFITTMETDQVIAGARERMTEFLGAAGPETISFGQNMTTLNYSLSKALSRFIPRQSEILITALDHEANRGPWLSLAEYGFKITEVKMTQDGTLDYHDFEQKLSKKTSLVAVSYASNAIGTVNNLAKIRTWCDNNNTLMLVDAVHYAPHFAIDVTTLDCDFLLCSAYKFYGPHVGILYCRPGLLDQLPTDRLITQDQRAPYRIETGTLNHAALAGVTAAIDYLASFGEGQNLRSRLISSMKSIQAYEFQLFARMYQGLKQLPGINISGLPPDPDWHTPTISFALSGYKANEVCEFLATKGICAWDGHFYAQRAIESLGLLEAGGVTRFGISMYTTVNEVDYTIEMVRELALKNPT
jgi:cysteine desulfurase family protein (TIGR01976 family)